MLTDIFSTRYSDRPLWNTFGEAERVLVVQCFRNVSEQVMPYWRAGKVDEPSKKLWESVEGRLSMELGLPELSPHTYGYYNVQKIWISGTWSMDRVCKDWVLAEFKQGMDPDRFMKERVGFIELAFREREQSLIHDAQLFELMGKQGYFTGKSVDSTRRSHETLRAAFNAYQDELNERFRRAKAPLNYQNGFIQFTADERMEMEVVQPFWKLVADNRWENVSIDMAEAVDRRDTGGRDPVLYAAKALKA